MKSNKTKPQILLIFCTISFIMLACNQTSDFSSQEETLPTSTPVFSSIITPTNTPSPSSTHTLTPTASATSTLPPTPTPSIWEIQTCHTASTILYNAYTFIWEYAGDLEGQGDLRMLIDFTEDYEILGYAFDFDQIQEFQVYGCVEQRVFTMWLLQEDIVEAVIQGEFPESDPRGHYSSSSTLTFDVIVGSLINKDISENSSVYLKVISGIAGSMEHRFELAEVERDTVILYASQQFLTAIANDDRDKVVDMIQFPVTIRIPGGNLNEIQSPETFLAQYDVIFDCSFKQRLAITFPNYLMAYAGNFIGTIGLSVYGGGGIDFDENGKVTGIYNWEQLTPTP